MPHEKTIAGLCPPRRESEDEKAEPLPVVVPLVNEEGEWKLSLSVNEEAADQWQHVEPTNQ